MSDLKKKITAGFKLLTDVLELVSKKYGANNPNSSGAALLDAAVAGLETAKNDIIKDYASGVAASLVEGVQDDELSEKHEKLHNEMLVLAKIATAKADPPAGTKWEAYFLDSWPSISDAINLTLDFLDGTNNAEKIASIVLDSFSSMGAKLKEDLTKTPS